MRLPLPLKKHRYRRLLSKPALFRQTPLQRDAPQGVSLF